jgi:long-subunit acyl-CoA synthetase (AMP-forming)
MTEKRWNNFVNLKWEIPCPVYHLSFAPLSHVLSSSFFGNTFETVLVFHPYKAMERQQMSVMTTFGATICILKNAELLLEEIESFRPSFLNAPPRVWNLVYHNFQQKLEAAISQLPADDDPIKREQQISVINSQLMADTRAQFGKRLKYIVTGGDTHTHSLSQAINLQEFYVLINMCV